MPSRMSCSLVTTRTPGDRRATRPQHLAPHERTGTDDVDPAGVHERQCRRSARDIAEQRAAGEPVLLERHLGEVDGVAVVAVQAEGVRGDRRDASPRARRPRPTPDEADGLARRRRGPRHVGAGRDDLVVGRRVAARGAARSSARSRCPSTRPASASSVPRTSSVEPPPRSTTRYGPAMPTPPRSPGGPRERQPRLLLPGTTSGTTSRSPNASTTPSTKSSALRASREADVATNRTASTPCSRQAAAYSRVMASVRAIASAAMTPVRSTPWPSRTTSIRRRTSVSSPSSPTSATRRRIELVPQSTAPTRRSSLVLRGASADASAHGCRSHHGGEHREGLVAERVDPGPGGRARGRRARGGT